MGLFASGHIRSNWIPRYTGLQIQTSSNAVPIGIVYGTNRIAPNVFWTGGFFAIPQYTSSSRGGKGGGGQQLQGYNYYTSFMMGVSEGPIATYRRIFANNNIFYDLYWAKLTVSALGKTPQGVWGFLSSSFPGNALNYNGLAYVGAVAYPLGSSPNLPQFSFEVQGRLSGTSGINQFDADPALMIEDFLTNAQYGVGFPSAGIDATTLLSSSGNSDSSYQTYCKASYLALSATLSNQETANSILSRWLKLTNTAGVWSGGKLKFIPYGDAEVTYGGGITFIPNITPVYSLGDNDFVHEDSQDPIQVERSDPYASNNWQRLTISQRSHYYAATPIDAFDQNAIDLFGLRMAPDITADEICDNQVGQISAQLILQRQLYIRNHYKFKLSFEYCLLEPMDIVTISDSNIGLNNAGVRIIEIEEVDDGLLSITAEEFPASTGSAAQYPTQGGNSNSTDQNVVPARVNPPVIYEPPSSLTGGTAQVWTAVSGGIAPAYHLAEDSSTGTHLTSQVLNSSETLGTAISFSVFAQAAERSAVRLSFDSGAGIIGCGFDLSAGVVGTPDTGINPSITNAGNGWFLCVIQGTMLATATPTAYIAIQNPVGTSSYPGVTLDGLYIWGAEFAAGTEDSSFQPSFTSVSGATIVISPVPIPEGVPGSADPNWGGAFVWLSTDNATYGQIGTVTAPARQGVLTGTLAAPTSPNPDTADSLSVSLIESGGQLSSTTGLAAQNGTNLCLAGTELLTFQTATLTGTHAYNLTTLFRGLHGTISASFPTGTAFVYIDNAIFQYDLPIGYIGVTLYMKFQSFNIFGQAVEDLSECTVYTYTPSGAGQSLGPVAQALALGQSLDFQLASQPVTESDDFGTLTGTTLAIIDLGNVTS